MGSRRRHTQHRAVETPQDHTTPATQTRQPATHGMASARKKTVKRYAPHRGFCRKSRQSVSTSANVSSRLDLDTTKPMKSKRISRASPCGRRAPSSFKDRGSRGSVPAPPLPMLATLPRLSARLLVTPASFAAVCAFARYRRSSCSGPILFNVQCCSTEGTRRGEEGEDKKGTTLPPELRQLLTWAVMCLF